MVVDRSQLNSRIFAWELGALFESLFGGVVGGGIEGLLGEQSLCPHHQESL